jgi:hypothetical protein
MNTADRVIRWSTALAVIGVAAVAAVVSYEHASALIRARGESGWTGHLIPLTVDGLIYASSMVMLDSARRGARMPALARWLLGLGIVATLAANVAHGLGHGIVGAVVAAWPAIALVGSYELLMMIIRGAQTPTAAPSPHDGAPVIDPLGEQAAVMFAAELAADRVPSVRAIRAALHVGQPRAAAARVPGRSRRYAWRKPGGVSGDRRTRHGVRARTHAACRERRPAEPGVAEQPHCHLQGRTNGVPLCVKLLHVVGGGEVLGL